MHTNKGFTLIEILIVIVIIGITISFALLAFGDFGSNRRLLFAGEQLKNTLELIESQSILDGYTYGLNINNHGYQLLRLKDNKQWQTIPHKSIFRPQSFPDNTVITLKPSQHKQPAIVINSTGDITAFTLTIGTQQNNNLATLTGKTNGTLSFTTSKTE